ncbi:competence/damage-inducible protein A [Virgibacillus kekensis]|uniref:Putative competence-damage inducible protein n=1 Tax=Virgibacillus kekensis TaxID=202261 RepID=A0ABV9DFT4_9BACI
MKQTRAEIVAVGTELLLGQISNTNAQWMSTKLADVGMDVFYHSVVGDNLERVYEQFRLSSSRSDVILVTGGLGPTEDDLTREAFQKLAGYKMVEHQPSMQKIEAFYKERNAVMTENNRKQARVFEGAVVIENNVGMAPGMIVSHQGKTWIFMPGVPREMKQMMNDSVLPHLQNLTGEQHVIESTMLKFSGIGESTLEDTLSELIQTQSNPTIAPLAQEDGVAIRLTAKAATRDEARSLLIGTKKQILDKAGDHYFGSDEETLEQLVVKLLKEKGKTIAAAESLTGGLFTERLISVPGASDVCRGGVVCYDISVKEDLLKVPGDILKENGTVSEECASSMAENISGVLGSDLGISFTGVAGPDQVEGHPAGTVYIAIYSGSDRITSEKFFFQGNRQLIRKRTVIKGLELLYKYLKK